jgi:hypothetical protein
MTAEEWRDVLLCAADQGSDCLRDAWSAVPPESRDELEHWLFGCKIVAMAADAFTMQETRH